jgi:hypothetical protein
MEMKSIRENTKIDTAEGGAEAAEDFQRGTENSRESERGANSIRMLRI